jgi:deoxyribodipyrimidine photolyase-related protein
MTSPIHVRLVFPHQLFVTHFETDPSTIFVLIEDDLYFRQYKFHKQKLVLHRASMQSFAQALTQDGRPVECLESSPQQSSMTALAELLNRLNVDQASYYELTDDWLTCRLTKLLHDGGVKATQLESPGFLTSLVQVDEFFSQRSPRMQTFYEWQRKRLGILIEADGTPVGGKWSFDESNRKKLPKSLVMPPPYSRNTAPEVEVAKSWVEVEFATNPGRLDSFEYPTTHAGAESLLQAFIHDRLPLFGPYEDAISSHERQIFHSLLSPLLNIGLLTPQQVLDAVVSFSDTHPVPIESLEGFIRQLIGWREYMRATYLRHGRSMRQGNYFDFSGRLSADWWTGTVGLEPVDNVIKTVLDSGYAHHIERLMILGNLMVLLRIHPDEVYEWFMSLFIDAYDWVMVPNVYAMSQFAAGTLITTKPYISGSNYIIKMSDYRKGEWSEVWDSLYWTFINDHRATIEKNYRSRMLVTMYDKFEPSKKQGLSDIAARWLPSGP